MEERNRPQPKVRDRGLRNVEKKAKRLERLIVTYVGIDELKPNSYNPNRQNDHDFELLLSSIREDGFTQPIVCTKDFTIVDGEHRWRGARKLGMEKIPVVVVDMNADQMRISTLRHNRARGSEDIDLSTEVLRDLRELGALDWAKDSLLMTNDEMEKLMDDIPAAEALAGDEFSEAWIPAKEKSDTVATGKIDLAPNVSVSASEKVVELVNETAEKIKDIDDDKIKKRFLQETSDKIYKISVSFSGEEADVVKAILGEKPAERLKELALASIKTEVQSGQEK